MPIQQIIQHLAKQLSGWKGKEKLFKDPELKGYIDSLDFKVGNKRLNGTYYRVSLIFANLSLMSLSVLVTQ